MSNSEMETIRGYIGKVREEVLTGLGELKTEVLDMKGDVNKLRSAHAKMGTDFEELRGQVGRIEEQLGCTCKQNGDGN